MKIRSAVRLALICFTLTGGTDATAGGIWRERGFADFADGTFGNAGHNLYVSKTGALQRIFRFDFNEDGWTDLAIAYHKVWGDHVGYSEVWWNGPDGFNPRRVTRLPTKGPHGMTAIELGNQRDRGPEEYYESSPQKLPDGAAATKISWIAQTPPKTWVKAQLRRAATKAELKQAAWHGPDGPGTWFVNGQAVDGGARAGQWVQYRLALGAVNAVATPRVTEVSVEYGESPAARSQ